MSTDDDAQVIDLPVASEPGGLTGDPGADTILGQLLREPDAAARYRTARALQDAMSWLAAVSAAQLAAEEGSVQAAALTLGVSRQFLDRIIREEKAPAPRRGQPDPATSPAYAYGQLIAVCGHLARTVDRQKGRRMAAQDIVDKLFEHHLPTTGVVVARLRQEATRWEPRLNAEERALVNAAFARLSTDLPSRLGPDQQAQAIVGYHHERKRLSSH